MVLINGDVEILTTDVADFIAYGDNATKMLGSCRIRKIANFKQIKYCLNGQAVQPNALVSLC